MPGKMTRPRRDVVASGKRRHDEVPNGRRHRPTTASGAIRQAGHGHDGHACQGPSAQQTRIRQERIHPRDVQRGRREG